MVLTTNYERAKQSVPGWNARPRDCPLPDRSRAASAWLPWASQPIQPIFVPTDLHFAEERIGAGRRESVSMLEKTTASDGNPSSGRLRLSSKAATSFGIHAAITRQDHQGYPPGGWHPEECLTPMEALALFTTGSAYAARKKLSRKPHTRKACRFCSAAQRPIRSPAR